jgi:CheY-like chemotaxis protein
LKIIPLRRNLPQRHCKKHLASNHITVIPTGEEAMTHLRNPQAIRSDLIFMDLHLPGKDGLEILAELRKNSRLHNIPVVILTGSVEPEKLAEVKKNSGFQHLVKPNDLDGYITRMKAILESFSGV